MKAGFTLPDVLIALLIIAFMVPGILSYQGNLLLLMGRARAHVELASCARALIAEHLFDKNKVRVECSGDLLIYNEQPIPKDSPLVSYENLKIGTVTTETVRLNQKMLFATIVREEKKDDKKG